MVPIDEADWMRVPNRHAGVLHWNGPEILDWYLSTKKS